MIMKKNLQIFLLGLLFVASSVCGYFIGAIIFSSKSNESVAPIVPEIQQEPVVEEITEPEVAYSTKPSIIDVVKPNREKDGTYSFTVSAEVESGDSLKYELYKDAEFTDSAIASNSDGVFSKIQSSPTAKYYVRVVNSATEEYDSCEVSGFQFIQMFTKITKAEIEKLVNEDRLWAAKPKGFESRIANKFKLTIEGRKDDEKRKVSTLAEVCSQTKMNIWKSIDVDESSMSYDDQNRLLTLTIKVNYKD